MTFSAALIGTSLLCPDAAQAYTDMPAGKRYWNIMESSPPQERVVANEALLDYAVGTINTQFYDNTGGAYFDARDFYSKWRTFRRVANHEETKSPPPRDIPTDISLESRQGAVQGLRWLVGTLNDPFSKYLTKEELRQELGVDSNGFLGVGAVVEPPRETDKNYHQQYYGPTTTSQTPTSASSTTTGKNKKFLTVTRSANLPVITAVVPDSPAERAGLVVGDRIVAVGDQDFLGWTRAQVTKTLRTKYNAESYLGHAKLTVAKPVYASSQDDKRDVVIGYRQTRVLLPTKVAEPMRPVTGGDAIVHYELLVSSSGSIFDHNNNNLQSEDSVVPGENYKVGYIRLTRFSKASTLGYLQAVEALEAAGAQSYIFDLRNNYGGVIQEAMLTASTLLRDPHSILCYTMNARGGFTPHDAEEYIVDKRYPGYMLSSESKHAAIDQVQREEPAMFQENGIIAWDPPSSYASLHEQVTKRGIRRISYVENHDTDPLMRYQIKAQKKVVVLMNEGTASAAEIFTAALHDNARTVALVGTKSYGKGLIQHTFPMPDGGGLRLTVAEYLTPSLRHVTNVGGARFDPETGEFVGGGIRPDIFCESKQGIPGNIRADLCVGVALDALEEEADSSKNMDNSPDIAGASSQLIVNRMKRFF